MYLTYLKICKRKYDSHLENKHYLLNTEKSYMPKRLFTYKFKIFKNFKLYFPNSSFYKFYFKKFKLLRRYFKISRISKHYIYSTKVIHIKYFKHFNNYLNMWSYTFYKFGIENRYAKRFLRGGRKPYWLLSHIVRNYNRRLWKNFNKFKERLKGYRYIFDIKTDNILFYWYKYKYYRKFPFKDIFLPKINFFFKYVIYDVILKQNYYFTTSKFLCFFKNYFLSLFILKSFDFLFLFKRLWISKLFKEVKKQNFYLFLLYRFPSSSLNNFNVYKKRRHWGRQNLPMFAQMSLIYNFINYRGVFILIGKYIESATNMTFSGYRTPYIVTKVRKSFWRDMTKCFGLYSYYYFAINSNISYLMYPKLIKLNLFRNAFVEIGWSVATRIILGRKNITNKFSYYYLNSKSLLIPNFYFNGEQALGSVNNYFSHILNNYSDYTFNSIKKNFLKKKKKIRMHRQEITSMRWIRENIKSFFLEKYKRTWFITRFCKYYQQTKTAGFRNFMWIEMRLSIILIRCKIVYLVEDAYELIRGGLVYVNGKVCLNVMYIIQLHDRIQFGLTKSFHLYHRELLSNALVKYRRLPAYVYSRYSGKNKFEMVRRDISARWPLKALWVRNDIPRYLEVDYLTMTIFVLYYPLYLKDIFPYYYLHIKFLSARCYNWRFFH